jgi:3alpha(or 20beta)-hydroxysteroid dehydrogenase
MGAEHARLFTSEGAKVVIDDLFDTEGRELASTHLYLADPNEWDLLVRETRDRVRALNITVNNTGTVKAPRSGPSEPGLVVDNGVTADTTRIELPRA